MKKLLLITLCSLVINCKSFHDFQMQNSNLVEGKSENISLENNEIIIPLSINNKKGKFLFDTGAMVSVITNREYINSFNLNERNYYTSSKLKGATGTVIESKHFISDTISSEIINGKGNIFRYIEIKGQKINCSDKLSNFDGIIGYDIFKKAGQPIMLDFENFKITVLNSNYSTNGFKKINANIPTQIGSKITIPFIIDGKKMNFLFDTGNNGGLLISDKNNSVEAKKTLLECETLIGSVDKISKQKIKIHHNVSVKLDDFIDTNTNITSFSKLITNTLGMSFIKHFNWILDFNNGTMYVKQISEIKNDDQNNMLIKLQLKSEVINDKLIIGFKNLSTTTNFKVGDEIISINNQNITKENICEIKELLNKTEDWNVLNLKVSSLIK